MIDHLDDGLEGGELHHGIRNLTAPQRVKALVQPSEALLGGDLTEAVCRALKHRRARSLHPHLDRFKWAERNVCEELGRGRSRKVERRLVLVGCLGASEVRVGLLEVLIPAILEGTLGGITEQGRAPTGEDATDTFGAVNDTPALKVALVDLRVDLTASLNEIEGRYSCVRQALPMGQ